MGDALSRRRSLSDPSILSVLTYVRGLTKFYSSDGGQEDYVPLGYALRLNCYHSSANRSACQALNREVVLSRPVPSFLLEGHPPEGVIRRFPIHEACHVHTGV